MTTSPPAWLDAVHFNDDGLVPAIAQDHSTGRILMLAWMSAEALALTARTNTAVYYSRSRGKLWHKGETSGHTQHVHEIRLDCDADVIVLQVTQIGGIACHTGRESCFYQRLDGQGDTAQWQTVDKVLKDPDDIYGQTTQAQPLDKQTLDKTTAKPTESATLHDIAEPTSHTVLAELDVLLQARKSAEADSSYVASLYAKGLNKILEKVGEEAIETILAAKDVDAREVGRTEGLPSKETRNAAGRTAEQELVYEIADVWFHTLVTLAWFNMSSDLVLAELARRFGLSGLQEKAARPLSASQIDQSTPR